ncbi:MAG TPA: fused MFS/spermidine synthase [Pyrinomonadaceae bacterium]|jgi:spermidine synthase|nr:fused MFS/spermidine synthase [Pyrinomonadaceae bacterium]
MPLLFAATLFLSALLLFWVQPLAGKMVLPLLGGAPAVWNTCLLFFQAALLAGYGYVHASTRWLSTRAQVVLHVALLAAAALALPVAVSESRAGAPDEAHPALWLLKTLALTAGPPFLALSASAPLLQKWFSRTRDPSAKDPYFLYSASNAGSLLALLAFPALFEPTLTLGGQARAWAMGYGALAVLVVACAAASLRAGARGDAARGSDAPADETDDARATADEGGAVRDGLGGVGGAEALTPRRRLRWALLAFVPSSLVMGVTTYVTTDLVAVPLLWVVPLALYLLSFVIVFARGRVVSRGLAAKVLPGAAVMLALVYLSGATQPAWFLIFFHLLFLFTAALVCHGQLADDRPDARHLSEFYLWLAAGGALGGLFNALVAPLVFRTVVEYPLVIVLASYLRPAFRRERGRLFGLRLGARRGAVVSKFRAEGGDADDEGGAASNGRAADVESVAGSDEDAVGVSGAAGAEGRVRVVDLLPPLYLGALAAALSFMAQQFEVSPAERAALALGAPLFLLNYFFAPRPLRFAVGLCAIMLASAYFYEPRGPVLDESRNFYGTHRVTADSSDRVHWLSNGSTLHGTQYTDMKRACEPLSYYHREGPLGSVFAALGAKPDARPRGVAVVGLGAGTTAAYARAGESWTFYEIDPEVIRIAREPLLFSYLSSCAAAPVNILTGDARLRLREAPPNAYDLIVLDAFSSDAVPAHLLTREAVALYLSKLAPGGLIAFHVSNRSLELERVALGVSADAGLDARVFADEPDEEGRDPNHDASTWVVAARSAEDLGALARDARWQAATARDQRLEVWRDDFSNVVTLFKGF